MQTVIRWRGSSGLPLFLLVFGFFLPQLYGFSEHALTGRVLDDQQSPVQGVAVSLIDSDTGQSLGSSVTNVTGEVTFSVTENRRVFLRGTILQSVAETDAATMTEDTQLILRTVGVVAQLRDSQGDPITGSRVNMRNASNNAQFSWKNSDAQGEARFEVFPGEAFYFQNQQMGYFYDSPQVIAAEGATVTMQTVPLVGRFLDSQGQPLSGAFTYLRRTDNQNVASQFTDEHGEVRFEVYPGFEYMAMFRRYNEYGQSNMVTSGLDAVMTLNTVALDAELLRSDGGGFGGNRLYLRTARNDANATSVVLGEDGRMRFEVLPGHDYYGLVQRYGIQGRSQTVTSGDGQTLSLQTVGLQGRFLDSAGMGQAGKRLYLQSEASETSLAHGNTDADGQVMFEVFPGPRYRLFFDWYGNHVVTETVDAESNQSLLFQTEAVPAEFLKQSGEGHPNVRLTLMREGVSSGLISQNTDASGRTRFEAFPGERLVFYVKFQNEDAFSSAVTVGDNQVMRLQSTVVTAEFVTSQNEPLGGHYLYLHREGVDSAAQRLVSDQNGTVAFEVLPGLRYFTRALRLGDLGVSNTITSGDGVRMRIQTVPVVGALLKSGGDPHLGQRLWLIPEGETSALVSQVVDADGRVRFEVIAGTRWLLKSFLLGGEQETAGFAAGDGQTHTLRTMAIEGFLTNGPNNPRSGVRVYLNQGDQPTSTSAVSNAEGRCFFEVHPGVTYSCRASIEGALIQSNSVVSGDDQVMVLTTQALVGRVRYSDGRPFPNFRMFLTREGSNLSTSVVSGVDGTGTFYVAPGSGRYQIRIAQQGVVGYSNTVDADSGEVMEVQLKMVEGRVLSSSGGPISGLRLYLNVNGTPQNGTHVTDAYGIGRFQLLPNADYSFRTVVNGGLGHSSTISGETDERMELRLGRTRAQLINSWGEAISGVTVQLKKDGSDTVGSAVTDAEGLVTFETFPGLNYQVAAVINRTTGLSPEFETTDDRLVRLRTSTVGVRVMDETRQPIGGSRCQLLNADGSVVSNQYVDNRGVGEFDVFGDQPAMIRASVNNVVLEAVSLETENLRPNTRAHVVYQPGETPGSWFVMAPVITGESEEDPNEQMVRWTYSGDAAVRAYQIYRGINGEYSHWQEQLVVPGQTTYTLFDRPNNGPDQEVDYLVVPEFGEPAACEAPTNLHVVEQTETRVRLGWDGSSVAGGYVVSYRATGAAAWIDTYQVTGTLRDLNDLTPDTAYEWKVRAHCGPEATEESAVARFVFGELNTCEAPAGTFVSDLTETTATLSWDTALGVGVYQLRWMEGYREGEIFGWNEQWVPAGDGGRTSVTLDSLEPGTQYMFEVAGLCGFDNESDATARTPFRTLGRSLLPGYMVDSFDVDDNGNAVYIVGIQVPTDIGDMKPELSLRYNSAAGNGILGMGWVLDGVSGITRCPPILERDGKRDVIRYDAEDYFCYNGQPLIAVGVSSSGDGFVYRTEVESFVKVESFGRFAEGPEYFEVTDSSGMVSRFGKGSNARSLTPDRQAVQAWLLAETSDRYKNLVTYNYRHQDDNVYIDTIDYAQQPDNNFYNLHEPNHQVSFEYEERPDSMKTFIKNQSVVNRLRLSAVKVSTEELTVRRYDLRYRDHQPSMPSRLFQITEQDESGATYPTLTFDWRDRGALFDADLNDPGQDEAQLNAYYAEFQHRQRMIRFGDFDGDGIQDVYLLRGYRAGGDCTTGQILISDGRGGIREVFNGVGGLAVGFLTQYDPVGIREDARRLDTLRIGDFNGDGISDLLLIDAFGDGAGFNRGVFLSNGDGTYRRRKSDLGAIKSGNDYLGSAELIGTHVVDVNGDGRSDVLAFRDSRWNQNQLAVRVLLADVDGNLVEDPDMSQVVDSGTIFHPERRQLDVARIRLGDFNGDGLIDFVYPNRRQLFVQQGDGWQVLAGDWPIPNGAPHDEGTFEMSHADQSRWRVGDFNGDGRHDFYFMRFDLAGEGPQADVIKLSRGDGTFEDVVGPTLPIDGGSAATLRRDLARAKFLDLDGNGTTDIYYVGLNADAPGDTVYLFDGMAGWSTVAGFNTRIHGSGPREATVALQALQFADMTGNGRPDLYYAYSQERENDRVYLNRAQTPKITNIRHQYGRSYTIDYGGLSDGDVYRKNHPTEVALEPALLDPSGNPFNWSDCMVYSASMDEQIDRGLIARIPHEQMQPPFYSVWLDRWLRSDSTAGWETATDVAPALAQSAAEMLVPAMNYPVAHYQGPMEVVAAVRYGDGSGGEREERFEYTGARVHLAGYGFLGFETVTTHDLVRDRINRKTFRLAENRRYGGFLTEQTVHIGDQLVNRGQRNYQFTTDFEDRVMRADMTGSATDHFDLNSGAHYERQVVSLEINDYGLLQESVQRREVPGDDSRTVIVQTENLYQNRTELWPYNLLDERRTTLREEGGATTKITQWLYNAQGSPVQETEIYPGTEHVLVQKFEYNAIGNMTASTVTGGDSDDEARTVRTFYAGRMLHPRTTINALGHETNYEYDTLRGRMLSVTDPNGLTTRYRYNSSGEVVLQTLPSGAFISHDYQRAHLGLFSDQRPPAARRVVTTRNVEGKLSAVFFDGLDRKVKIVERDPEGRLVMQRFLYDDLGRQIGASQPYFDGEEPVWSHTEYDAFDRVIAIDHADGRRTTYSYEGHTTTTVHQGQQRVVTVDLRGRTLHSENNLGEALVFSYQRNNQGVTHLSVDPAGNHRSVTYNHHHQPTRIVDPNMGDIEMGYNLFGERISRVDHLGRGSSYSYDALGRMIRKENNDGVGHWTYDEGLNAIGKLTRIVGPDGYETAFTFDEFGRDAARSWTIHGRDYQMAYGYNANDQWQRIDYPAGFAVTLHYGSSGALSAIREVGGQARELWRAEAMNARGHLTRIRYGNGVVAHWDYDPLSNQVTNIGAEKDGTSLQDLSYTYDTYGNLAARQDHVVAAYESFAYDDINRLTRVDTTRAFNEGRVDVAYDLIGNIASKSDVGSYLYDADRPNAVTQAGEIHYAYDGNGNMIDRRHNGNVDRFTYNAADKPTIFDRNNGAIRLEFDYNPDGERYSQRRRVGATQQEIDYLDQWYEAVSENGVLTHVNYVFAGSRRVAVHTQRETGSDTRFFHQDRLGGINTVTDEDGAVAERLSFDAFGKRRRQDWDAVEGPLFAQTTRRGFTDHEMLDDFELIHMNGRVYDPVIARFMTPDDKRQLPTLLEGADPYAYLLNNPLSTTDPTGHFLMALPALAGSLANYGAGAFLVVVAGGVVGGTIGAVIAERRGGEWLDGAKKGFTIGATITYGVMKGRFEIMKAKTKAARAAQLDKMTSIDPKEASIKAKEIEIFEKAEDFGAPGMPTNMNYQEGSRPLTYDEITALEEQGTLSTDAAPPLNMSETHVTKSLYFNGTTPTGSYGTPPPTKVLTTKMVRPRPLPVSPRPVPPPRDGFWGVWDNAKAHGLPYTSTDPEGYVGSWDALINEPYGGEIWSAKSVYFRLERNLWEMQKAWNRYISRQAANPIPRGPK